MACYAPSNGSGRAFGVDMSTISGTRARQTLAPWIAHRTIADWCMLAARLFGVVALAFLLVRAPLPWVGLVVIGGIAAVALLLRPALGLGALAFSIPFSSTVLQIGGLAVGASELLLAATLAAWLARMVARRQVRVLGNRLTLALAIYIGALCFSLLPATNLAPAAKELAKWLQMLAVYTLVISEPSAGDLRLLVGCLLTAGTLEAALGIYQFLFQVGPPGFILMGRYMRAYGTFAQPNPFGGYLGLLLPLGYSTVIAEWPSARRAWRDAAPWRAWLWHLALVATLVMLAGLVASWSRGALAGLVAGGILVALALGKKAWPLVPLCLILLLLVPQMLPALPADLVGRLNEAVAYIRVPDLATVEVTDANFSIIERLAHWVAAWRMFGRSPWLGVGTGQYATAYPSVALPRWQDPLGHAHNFYLNVLAEAGLLGLCTYLAMLCVALCSAWRSAHRQDGWRRGVALGAVGMLGHLLVHSALDNLYVHGMYLIVGIVLGMAIWEPQEDPGLAEAARLMDA